jgi:hypothetical protein
VSRYRYPNGTYDGMPHIKRSQSFSTSCRHKVPRNQTDQATAADLSAQFRMGAIYAYAYEDKAWWVWATQADWDATERHTPDGRVVRDQTARAAGHGPSVYTPAPVSRPKRPTKAEAIALLKAIAEGTDWQVEELEQLLAREAA